MRKRRLSTRRDPVIEFESFEHFVIAGSIPNGRFVVPYEGIPVDFLYEPTENARVTVVFFHGSTKRDVSLPKHAGARIMQDLPANRLAISDPSLTLDDKHELILSWFAGSARQPHLQHFLEGVIRRVFELNGGRHRIFMGSSGGGFASLEMSRRFPGSLALVMNPQIVLNNYHRHLTEQYLELCWDSASSIRNLPSYGTFDLRDAYSTVLTNTIGYIQNTRDNHHVTYHQVPFFEQIGLSRRVFTLMDAWGDPAGKGHVIPPAALVNNILAKLVASNGAWRKCLLDLGFTHETTPDSVRAMVDQANAGLPDQLVADNM